MEVLDDICKLTQRLDQGTRRQYTPLNRTHQAFRRAYTCYVRWGAGGLRLQTCL
jgi:hypothetical protein